MAKVTRRRQVRRTTLLAVGEGPHDQAFLEHMKGLYDSRDNNQQVTIKAADGGSPGDILRTVLKRYQHADYDRRIILLDADVAIPDEVSARARREQITLLLSEPLCLEGMLLDVLHEKVPGTSQECKRKLQPRLDGPPTEKRSYARLFPRPLLDETPKATIGALRQLMQNAVVDLCVHTRDNS